MYKKTETLETMECNPLVETPSTRPLKQNAYAYVTYQKKKKMLMLHRFIIMFSVLIADAGKSTTGGQILFLSGQVDDRTIQKYEKEAKDKSRESW